MRKSNTEQSRLLEQGLRRCNLCHEIKAIGEFGKNSGAPDGIAYRCKPCNRAVHREAYKNLDYAKRKNTQDRIRSARLTRTFNLTDEQYLQMLDDQGGCCAICREPAPRPSGKKWSQAHLAVDHDHATGQVRGLLCTRCNTGLGRWNDNLDHLRRAVAYLENS